ncbi:signal peptidase I SipW [Paenibacillus barengoltzii]|uniref:signal peptidase I SipW n=1 Tax=Paenibacillus barengoltzii TaxID=343517 RepID=UPI002FD9D656
MRIRKWLGNALTFLMAVAFFTVAGSVVLSKVFDSESTIYGYQLSTVLSDSMDPVIPRGSVVIIQPGGDMTRFNVSDVITFQSRDNKRITHRIVEVTQDEHSSQVLYRTKGDNNNAADVELVHPAHVTGVYTGLNIPYAGYILSFADSKTGKVTLLILPGLLLFLYTVVVLWKAIARLEDEKPEVHHLQSDAKSPARIDASNQAEQGQMHR